MLCDVICTSHVARMIETRNAEEILIENLYRRGYLEDYSFDCRIILICVIGKYCLSLWNHADSSESGWGLVLGFYEHGNEYLVGLLERIVFQ